MMIKTLNLFSKPNRFKFSLPWISRYCVNHWITHNNKELIIGLEIEKKNHNMLWLYPKLLKWHTKLIKSIKLLQPYFCSNMLWHNHSNDLYLPSFPPINKFSNTSMVLNLEQRLTTRWKYFKKLTNHIFNKIKGSTKDHIFNKINH